MRNVRQWHPVWWVTLLLTAAVVVFARVVPSGQGTADARFVELAKAALSQPIDTGREALTPSRP